MSMNRQPASPFAGRPMQYCVMGAPKRDMITWAQEQWILFNVIGSPQLQNIYKTFYGTMQTRKQVYDEVKAMYIHGDENFPKYMQNEIETKVAESRIKVMFFWDICQQWPIVFSEMANRIRVAFQHNFPDTPLLPNPGGVYLDNAPNFVSNRDSPGWKKILNYVVFRLPPSLKEAFNDVISYKIPMV